MGTFTATLTVTDQDGATATDNATAIITDSPPVDQPPTANANGPYSGTTGSAIAFSSVGSFDPEGAWTAAWDFGDGATSSALNPSHSYTSTGSYTVALTVTDQAGQTASDNAAVTVADGGPPPSGPYPNEPAGATVLVDYDTDFSVLTDCNPCSSPNNPPWRFIRGAQNLSTITDNTAPGDPTKVAQVTFPVGCCDGSGPARLETYGGAPGTGAPPGDWTRWYVSDWIKFDADFQPHNVQKLFQFLVTGGGENHTLIKADSYNRDFSFPLRPQITIEWQSARPTLNLGNGAVSIFPDIWYQYEFILHDTGRLQLWVRQQGSSPVQIYDGTPASWGANGTSGNKILFWWWGYGGNGAYPWNGNPALGPGHIYHNHFRVSYIP